MLPSQAQIAAFSFIKDVTKPASVLSHEDRLLEKNVNTLLIAAVVPSDLLYPPK